MNPRKIISVLIFLCIGFAIGFLSYFIYAQAQEDVSGNEDRVIGKYKLVNPLLECDVAQGRINSKKINFKEEINSYVDSLINDGVVHDISLYFRDLNNGPTFGIRQENPYIPASLLKVPVMMAYYRMAEDDPKVLTKMIKYEKPITISNSGVQLISPSVSIEVGRIYSVNELINHAIMYSDNQAVSLLLNDLPKDELKSLYDLLGVDSKVLFKENATLTVKNYSAFFRILFNASYLNTNYSERALALLTLTKYDNGLVAGIPGNITVSHKFGEAGFLDELHQLHDCGIIYYPKHPYLLCIMTRGSDTASLEKAISSISKFVYDEIDKQYKSEK